MSEELSEILENAELAVADRNVVLTRSLCEGLHPADLAELYEDQDSESRRFLVDTLGSEAFTEVLAEIPNTLVEETLDSFGPDQQREMLESIPDDDLVDILQDVSESKRRDYIGLLDKKQQDNTRTLLRYGEDTAGGRMTTQIARIRENMTVKEAIDHLRPELESTETMARIFVVDENERLIGKIRLRDLAFNPWNTPIREVLTEDDQSVLATVDQEEAAKMLSRYDLVLLPVVDESGRLLGVITADDAIEIIEEESTEDMEKAAGISGEQSEETYLNTAIYTHFRRRAGWLLILAFLAILSGFVMMRFEKTLTDIYLLSLFLPMVVAAGGNTGGQASTMVIRAMALGELDREDTARVVWKEFRLGILLGGLLAIFIGIVAVFGPPAFGFGLPGGISFMQFGLTVAIALGAQVATSTVIGALLPIGARAIKLDPAVIAAPAITTAVDVSGMVIYFTIAHSILSL
ncbi:magnesium transporter [Akkermansiaceae bacterium]|nr:magnesium transporter [Akkermansiaceae bacterium]